MKHLISTMMICLVLLIFCSSGLTQETGINKSWDVVFASDLEKISSPRQTDGLGYRLSDEEALDLAIQKAVDNGAPACQCVKLAVGLNFNPYSVLTGIFKTGKKIELDQLCMCATEIGDTEILEGMDISQVRIDKGIMKQAADDAVADNLLTQDEVSQAQCLDQGLAFTEAELVTAEIDEDDPTEYDPVISAQ